MIMLYFYILSIILTFVVLCGAFLACFFYYRRKEEYDGLESTLQSRFPKACWYEHLGELIADAESQLTQLRDEVAVARSIIEQRDAAEDELRENQRRLAEMEDDLSQQRVIEARLEDVQRKEAELNERLPKLVEDQAYREAKVRELTDAYESLVRQRDERELECDRLKDGIQSLQERENSLKVQLAGVDEQCRQFREELMNLTTRRGDLARELKDLEAQNTDIRIERRQLESDVSRLQAEKEGLREAIEHYRGLCREVEVAVPPERRAGQDRLVELWQPVLRDGDFREPQMDDENRCLEGVQDYLRQLGLRFHDRVLRAFHTSLKVADVSPLVVLAGISGTGKSLLPRRYAEGMGLHFLNLAVQPRWDSPQDMFGFYNYLEGRYRATELARALFQMDGGFDPDAGNWGVPKEWRDARLSNRMLIVLLDEMNLARIEYYFSDFLSKLEIRRDVKTSQDRHKAEIGLEVGLQQSSKENGAAKSPVLPLYVDTNVLFVGTMNEDETTQSLSDKVVDRANVLRFGSPRNLRASICTNHCPPPLRYLPYKTWLKWKRDEASLDATVAEQIDRWIGGLNDNLMSHIHRPFAHRTRLAMRTYVANYPRSDEAGVREAMADQIEQKILPKFRGLNPNEQHVARALDDVVKLVGGEFKDEQLAAAISECVALGKAEHQFIWLGLDRSDENR